MSLRAPDGRSLVVALVDLLVSWEVPHDTALDYANNIAGCAEGVREGDFGDDDILESLEHRMTHWSSMWGDTVVQAYHAYKAGPNPNETHAAFPMLATKITRVLRGQFTTVRTK